MERNEGGGIHFCCTGDSGSELVLIAISDMKDDIDFSVLTKAWHRSFILKSRKVQLVVKPVSNSAGRLERSTTRWRKAQRYRARVPLLNADS